MSRKHQRARDWIRKRQQKPKRKFPLATMVFYGPNDQHATRLTVALIENDGEEPEVLNRWMSVEGDYNQVIEQDGVILDVQIYRIPVSNWVLEVVDENRTSIVWDDEFDNDAEAWAEFQMTLREEGLEAFSDDEQTS